MSTYDFHVGQAVVYRDPNWPASVPSEQGVITAINPSFVFVRYGSDTHSKATLDVALTPLNKGKNNED